MEEEPPQRFQLNYQKPVDVFPTETGDRIVFWGCLTVFLLVAGLLAGLGFLVLVAAFLH